MMKPSRESVEFLVIVTWVSVLVFCVVVGIMAAVAEIYPEAPLCPRCLGTSLVPAVKKEPVSQPTREEVIGDVIENSIRERFGEPLPPPRDVVERRSE